MTLPEGHVLQLNCRLAKEVQKLTDKELRYVRFDNEYIKYRVTQLLAKITVSDKKRILSGLLSELEVSKVTPNNNLLSASESQEVVMETITDEIENEQV
ncbi:hypothetical protein CYANOKiyG1_27500 [Okeania sp. KiyG1]|nr:hypothetical protein CYANOKiyG1_27500 [Okeania sp. KiyG1]